MNEGEYTPGEAKTDAIEAIRWEAFLAGYDASGGDPDDEENIRFAYEMWRENELERERAELADLMEEGP